MGVASKVVSWHSLKGRRDTNQDAALVRELAADRLLVAVADGMGGHEGGADASRRALAALDETVAGGGSLAEGVDAANAAVYAEAASNPALEGMGTTVVALLREGDRYWIANVGDSRAYRIEGGRIDQVTVDHSFASEALGKGMSKKEIEASPWSNALTRSIGTDPEVEVDVFGPFSTEQDHWVCLCTDGLYRMLSDGEIVDAVTGSPDLEEVPRRLADLAYAAGSSDNITVALFAAGDGVTGPGSAEPVLEGSPRESRTESTGVRIAPRPTVPGRSRRKRWRHLSTKTKVEIWGVAITVALAAIAAYFVLNVL